MAQTTMMSPPPISQDAHLGDDVDGDHEDRKMGVDEEDCNLIDPRF